MSEIESKSQLKRECVLDPLKAAEKIYELEKKLEETVKALRITLLRATPDPEHDYRKCWEPSCVLGRKVLGEE